MKHKKTIQNLIAKEKEEANFAQSKISSFLIPTKFSKVQMGYDQDQDRQSKAHIPPTNNFQGKSSDLERPGSQQAHNQYND